MVDSHYLDWLVGRAHLFESCYLKGFNNLLLNVTLDTDDVLNRHIHYSDGTEAKKKLDRAEERMRQNVAKLRRHYANIPFGEFEVDPYADHLSVLKDLTAVVTDNVRSIVYDSSMHKGTKPRYASFEKGLECCLGSVMRCMALDGTERRVLSDFEDKLSVIATSGRMVAKSKEANERMGSTLVKACEGIGQMLGIMARACDTGFAPVVVTRYLLEDYDFWVDELLQERTDEAYDKVNLLSAGMRQVGYLYRAKFDFVIKKLQGIKGYEIFEVVVKDSEGKAFATRDINQL